MPKRFGSSSRSCPGSRAPGDVSCHCRSQSEGDRLLEAVIQNPSHGPHGNLGCWRILFNIVASSPTLRLLWNRRGRFRRSISKDQIRFGFEGRKTRLRRASALAKRNRVQSRPIIGTAIAIDADRPPCRRMQDSMEVLLALTTAMYLEKRKIQYEQ